MADGQENPVPTIQAMGFQEVQQYLNLTGHIQSSIQILINERVWQRLNAAQQQALRETLRELGEEVYAGTLQEEERILAQWREDHTLEIIEDVDVHAFRQRARQYFAQGFPFSQLYQRITAAEPPPGSQTDRDALVIPQDTGNGETAP
jgi:TRAP-type C4-dicarboxylate transport system substrate-binding protein